MDFGITGGRGLKVLGFGAFLILLLAATWRLYFVPARPPSPAGESRKEKARAANASGKTEEIALDTGIRAAIEIKANRAGIRGLKQSVHEWTVILSPDGVPQFYVHGLDNRESYLERKLWETFSNVGFNTVLRMEGNE